MDGLANVWPEGGLFAFSGIDGETNYSEPFIASGTQQTIGWKFHTTPPVTLSVLIGDMPLKPVRHHLDYCLSDCWRCSTSYEEASGVIQGAFINRYSMILSVDFDHLPPEVSPHVTFDIPGKQDADTVICSGHGWWLAMTAKPAGVKQQFGIAISYQSEAEAIQRAQDASLADVADVCEMRMDYYRTIAPPEWIAGGMLCTYYKAVSIQKAAIENPGQSVPHIWSLPARIPSAQMKAFDSVFHALGLQHNNPNVAFEIIRTLTSQQDQEGRIPSFLMPGLTLDAGGSHPPLLAWTITHLCERTIRIEFLEQMYPKLVAYTEWFNKNRRNSNGLYGWRLDSTCETGRGGESVMNDSPRFDNVTRISAVDLSSYMASEYFCLEKIARCLDRAGEAQQWRERRMQTADLLNTMLWDDEDRFYYDMDECGELIKIKTTAGFMPLLGLIPDRDRAEAMRIHLVNSGRFWSPVPVCSVSQDESAYSSQTWRGAAFCSINILIYYGLLAYGFLSEARRLARTTLTEIMRGYLQSGCMYEYYNSAGATYSEQNTLGANNQIDCHLTAAAYIHLAHELG